jgi:hypothetical protein
MRANMGGPPTVVTTTKASMAARHSLSLVLGLRKLDDVPAGILKGDELTAARQGDWIIKPTTPGAISH